MEAHPKVGIVDDRWLTLGSANLTTHSFFNDSAGNVVTGDARSLARTRHAAPGVPAQGAAPADFRVSAKQAEKPLEQWLAWARRSRLPSFVKLARRITPQRDGILSAAKNALSNARIEQMNTQIRLLARQAFGFHSPRPLIALAMLKLPGLRPPLPR